MLLRSIPENIQKKPVQRKPATDVRPTNVGKNQKPGPRLGQIYVLRKRHLEMAPGSTAKVEVAGRGGIVCGGGEEGGCMPPCCPKGGVKAKFITP
ncbi:hypothetical protein PAECIP111893_01222 [Paenibacillus plantiphilus]|uniref:Uncharacterized protein n=1 Tax=Paenibacillus plantiphilus TaxID=2905650 RepID=A0ABN8G9G8_9BACL|nr:hypothetical protein PAECIP111893_01222 [Paenibacillus plantiphilus]